MVQWLGVCLPMPGTQLPLVWKHSTCRRTPRLARRNYQAHELQLLKPTRPGARAPQQETPLQCEAPRKLKTLLRLQKARAQQWRTSAVKKKKKRIEEFPGGSVVGNSELPLQGAQVRSLMGELRPYKLHRVAKKKKRNGDE